MPTEHMLALGDYRFSVSSAAYQELSHSAEYRWAAQPRLGRLPARQYLGPGEESITLNGVIHPGYKGGLGQLDSMRAESAKGEPLNMSEGGGRIWGLWVIMRVEETRRVLDADGAPRRIEFRLQLVRYGEDKSQRPGPLQPGGNS